MNAFTAARKHILLVCCRPDMLMQVMVDRHQDQLVVNGIRHEMQCGQAFAMTWTLTDTTASASLV